VQLQVGQKVKALAVVGGEGRLGHVSPPKPWTLQVFAASTTGVAKERLWIERRMLIVD
jgi:hypothetical protein